MTIWDYPISTPFGQVAGYPLNNGFHNGIDYSAPVGTDITVNGVVIGKSGNTGASTGPHTHVGHWGPAGVIDPKPQGGKVLEGAKVTQVNEDSVNGKYVRVAVPDGTTWVYLHMSQQLVNVGQELKGEQVDNLNAGDLTNIHNATGWPGHDINNNDIAYWVNGTGNPAFANPKGNVIALLVEVAKFKAAQGAVNKDSALKYVQDNLK